MPTFDSGRPGGQTYKLGDSAVIPQGLIRHIGRGAAGTPHDGRYEVQRSHWFFIDIKPPSGVEPNVLSDPGNGDRFQFQASLSSIQLPEETSEVIEFLAGNRRIKMGGSISYNDSEFTFIDFVDARVGYTLASWRRTVYDPKEDRVGYMSNYKGEATIYLAATRHDFATAATWKLHGVWPKSVRYGSGQDYDAPGLNKIVATFVYDWAEMLDVRGTPAKNG